MRAGGAAQAQRKKARPSSAALRSEVAAALAILALTFTPGITAADCPPEPQQHLPQAPPPPLNIDKVKDVLLAYQAENYDGDIAAVFAAARAYVEGRAGQVSKPALVLDIDETSLSNWEEIHHNDFAYIPSGACDLRADSACGQRAWEMSASAGALQPTLDLFNFVKTLKGKDGSPLVVFFITGRYEDPFERRATEQNLRRAGYDDWRQLYMRPESTRSKTVSAYKAGTRADIEDRQRFTIIANIGDQFSDLVGGHAQKCFKVPNPFYFIAGDPLPDGGLPCLADPRVK
jgi:hypothetical protein